MKRALKKYQAWMNEPKNSLAMAVLHVVMCKPLFSGVNIFEAIGLPGILIPYAIVLMLWSSVNLGCVYASNLKDSKK